MSMKHLNLESHNYQNSGSTFGSHKSNSSWRSKSNRKRSSDRRNSSFSVCNAPSLSSEPRRSTTYNGEPADIDPSKSARSHDRLENSRLRRNPRLRHHNDSPQYSRLRSKSKRQGYIYSETMSSSSVSRSMSSDPRFFTTTNYGEPDHIDPSKNTRTRSRNKNYNQRQRSQRNSSSRNHNDRLQYRSRSRSRSRSRDRLQRNHHLKEIQYDNHRIYDEYGLLQKLLRHQRQMQRQSMSKEDIYKGNVYILCKN